ncbi:CD1375 family protein [Paenibacillus sp. USHLN196]
MQVFVTIYVSLIVAGRRTLEQVPVNIREDVKDDLVALGYEQ